MIAYEGWCLRVLVAGSVLGLVLWMSAGPAQAEFTNVAEEAGLAITGVRGAGWADYDADGCVDLLITSQWGATLFRNSCDGSGKFIDTTKTSGIVAPQQAWAPAWADYDNDGDLDVYITSGGSQYGSERNGVGDPNVLYRNNGDGTFTNVAFQAGVANAASSTGASWADIDNDGDLDLFVANRFRTAAVPWIWDDLYQNEGNGHFTKITPTAGIAGRNSRQTFMGVWLDYDNNGTQDLYLAVDFGKDVLYSNNGDNTFTDVSKEAGISGPAHGMGVAIGDPNGDGCLDIFSTNNTEANDAEHGPSVLYMNNCDGTFHNATEAFGILDRAVVEWGPNFIDWDNDGDLDLAVTAGGMLSDGQPNVLYENRCTDGRCVFHDVTSASKVDDLGAGFGSAWADYDNDGDLDWFVANSKGGPSALFRNDSDVGNYLK
ncbi:MAG: VCBS repeat-containing protein, partial [Alphaproteobacteria bacterium]|nr:VCBS repeat-containing protein [Alphaproteobacteria bacterium]